MSEVWLDKNENQTGEKEEMNETEAIDLMNRIKKKCRKELKGKFIYANQFGKRYAVIIDEELE